ncbi:anti-sigma-I factor RsgI family protein [Sedimentibacter saalensis]|uniref:RsgI N-terminal anti-sigma domain-containing protein n=1 Tax=Sedimentibacter saalensis TaxID=130788 RepID=A0A562J4M6_9FIRM|nr:hypothetical protein [Sedimentibacter saalensis]TWH78110.1 hypothetical protein LY60_02949 [Sedimentibacter saalensis]
MKAVIVEIKGSNAAVLSEDGRISQVKNRNYKIGQEISMSNNSYAKWALTAAAAMLLFVTPAWAYMTPYSYVSLDVNPSFEFSINRFDRVLEVKAVNGDAEEMVKEMNIAGLKNKEIKDAVRNVLTELKNQGYITEGEDGGVVVAASSKSEEKTNNLAAALKTAVNEEVGKYKEKDSIEVSKDTMEVLETENKDSEEIEKSDDSKKPEDKSSVALDNAQDKNKDKSENKDNVKVEKNASDKNKNKDEDDETGVEVEVVKVSQQKVDEAKEKGVTPGKMNIVDKLAEASGNPEDFDKEEWLDKPVKEIMEATKNYEKEAKNKDKDTEKSVEVETESKVNNNQGNGNSNNGNSGGKKN